jgi:dihydrofolate reductase
MIILDEIVSVDGWAARINNDIDFFVEREGLVETVGAADRMASVEAVLLGARTYREFSAYWPTQDPTLHVNRLPKHVLSATLEEAPWGDMPAATVERGDAVEVARSLESQYGGDIIIWGSLTVAEALLAGGVVDQVWLRVVPVTIGTGRSFWPAADLNVRLVETQSHPGGWATARYEVDRR